MEYRRLGASGIKVSELSFGSWVTFGKQIDLSMVMECIKTAYDAGINFFDNAEAYALGESETLMGQAFKELGFRRSSYLVSSKFFWGLHQGPNEKNTLNRKYLLEAIDGSLKRLQLDHLDLIFCHRPDPQTPIEETVWAMHDIVSSGKALYWGTSEWSAKEIREAFAVAEKYRLRKPVMEQPEYNLFHRRRVEVEYAPLFSEFGLGTTIWSPLASGVLTGKYLKGMPSGSRLSLKGMEWLKDKFASPQIESATRALQEIALKLECSLAQLALAWCLKNKNVSTVITGATAVGQLQENLEATKIVAKLDSLAMSEIERILSETKIESA
jgi:voltage-dependent potassium channel beta subunit